MFDMTNQSQLPMPSQEKEISILDILAFFIKNKKNIAVFTLLGSIVGLVAGFTLPPVYTATTTILPPQQNQSSMLSVLGSLGSLSGAAGAISGLKDPNQLYVSMLQSRTVADKLISQFDLSQRYKITKLSSVRKLLAGHTSILTGKDGLIVISVEDSDPAFAAKLANAYVTGLIGLNQNLAVTDAAKRRLFFEQQLKQNKDKLVEAEVALKQTQQKTGILQPEGQIQTIVANIAQLRANIASRQVQLASIRSFATEQNPQVIKLSQEIATLQQQLGALEKSQPKQGDIFVPTGQLPESSLEYVRRLRDVKYYETMFELMSKQYEAAKLDEAREGAIIQVIDKAISPDMKTRPRKSFLVLLGAFFGLLVSFIFIGVQRAIASNIWARLQYK